MMGAWLKDPQRKRADNAAVVLGLIGTAMMIISSRFEVGLAGLALDIASLLWTRRILRCRDCGFDVLWWAMRHQPSSRFVTSLVTLERCPGCGGPPRPDPGAADCSTRRRVKV